MSSRNRLDVTDLDFNSIKDNLKNYLRSQDTLQDYDFEGSALSTLIDVMAYATHYNAVNANLGLNETFLDTAQFRGSVVGHARALGYTPRSASAPAAYIDIVVNNPTQEQLVLPRGHRFTSVINNKTYQFLTLDEYRTDNGVFNNVKIAQGQFKTAQFIFDVNTNEKLLIPDFDADVKTLVVEVFESETSNVKEIYIPAKQITSINPDSAVYFLHENPDGKFEVTFGDNVIGKSPVNRNIIVFEYLVTDKAEANGAKSFSLAEPIQGNENVTITVRSPAMGGAEKESIESVRFNAPISYAAQNRAVTPQDYEAVIRENFANVNSVKVWGGEDNDPPIYGKVFVSVQPRDTAILTEDEKTAILNNILRPKSIVTVTPELIDPEFLAVTFEIFFKYDPTRTKLTGTQLETNVQRTVREYSLRELNRFNAVFRYSNFLKAIDQSDPAIINTFARIYIQKRFVPALNIKRTYELDFSVPLYQTTGLKSIIYSSSEFSIGTVDNCRFLDEVLPNGRRVVNIVRGSGGSQVTIVREAGFIEDNKIILTNFVPSAFKGNNVQIEVIPNSYDIAPRFNTILFLDCACARFAVNGQVDELIAGSEFSGVNYNVTPRHA